MPLSLLQYLALHNSKPGRPEVLIFIGKLNSPLLTFEINIIRK